MGKHVESFPNFSQESETQAIFSLECFLGIQTEKCWLYPNCFYKKHFIFSFVKYSRKTDNMFAGDLTSQFYLEDMHYFGPWQLVFGRWGWHLKPTSLTCLHASHGQMDAERSSCDGINFEPSNQGNLLSLVRLTTWMTIFQGRTPLPTSHLLTTPPS